MTKSFGPYTVSNSERVLRYRGKPVALASKAVDLLIVLLDDRERVVSKAELMERLWPQAYVDDANLTQNVYLLRKVFKLHQSGVSVENVPKRGYRLIVGRSQFPRRFPLYPVTAGACAVLCTAAAFLVAPLHAGGIARYDQKLGGAALRDYMLGVSYQTHGSRSALERSAQLFSAVIRRRPENARGYAGLAVTDASLAYYTGEEMRRVRLQADALSLAREAVRRDPASADAYAALGGAEFSIEHDSPAAQADLQRAITLDPNQMDALVWYGSLLLDRGDVSHARRLFARAVGIAPNAPGTVASLAWCDFIAGDYAAAIELSKQQLLARREPWLAAITLANAYLLSGDYALARASIRSLGREGGAPVQTAALSAHLDALTGHRLRAAARLRALEATADPRAIGSWDAASLAAAYVALGDRGRAFIWLTRVQPWERRQILRDPRFAALSRDRRFSVWVSG